MTLKALFRELELDTKLPYQNDKSNIPTALQTFWEAPTLYPEIWEYLFPTTPITITIPMYLHYIEGWGATMFESRVGISRPTFYRWITTPQLPARHRRVLIESMGDLTTPEDDELYKEALENENQWLARGKVRDYPAPKRLQRELDRAMKRTDQVDPRDYRGRNTFRLQYQIKNYAQVKGWVCVNGVYYEKKKHFKIKTMAD